MKKNYFRILVFLLLLSGSMTIISCSDDIKNEVDITITINDLPAAARSFLNKYFPDYEIVKITKEIESDITVYEVDLQEGYEVVFNEDGDWTQVEAPYGKTIPTGFIPEQVMATLTQRFQGYGINEINSTGQGYKVELSDNQGGASIDVFFDMSGEITGIDELD